MSDWDPQLYCRFETERTRPAVELLARVPLESAVRVADLGCGPGNSTALLAHRYPDAQITAVDTSESMLAAARKRLAQLRIAELRFERADIADWSAPEPLDLVFANAALQWVANHERLLPRLLATLRIGGVLAVQMPDNREEPTHALMRELAAEAPFSHCLGDGPSSGLRILPAERYYDLLARHADVDLWRTLYNHVLPSAAAIADWLHSTGLRPFLEPLSPDLQDAFLAEYRRRIEVAYPARADGLRLLRFPRLFIVARRRAAASATPATAATAAAAPERGTQQA